MGDKWVSANCKFSADKGLLRLDSVGVGTDKKDLPAIGPDDLAGEL